SLPEPNFLHLLLLSSPPLRRLGEDVGAIRGEGSLCLLVRQRQPAKQLPRFEVPHFHALWFAAEEAAATVRAELTPGTRCQIRQDGLSRRSQEEANLLAGILLALAHLQGDVAA